MRRLTVILGLLFSSLSLVPAAASAATAIEYGLTAPSTAADEEDWN
jgi:hypothetical protein